MLLIIFVIFVIVFLECKIVYIVVVLQFVQLAIIAKYIMFKLGYLQ